MYFRGQELVDVAQEILFEFKAFGEVLLDEIEPATASSTSVVKVSVPRSSPGQVHRGIPACFYSGAEPFLCPGRHVGGPDVIAAGEEVGRPACSDDAGADHGDRLRAHSVSRGWQDALDRSGPTGSHRARTGLLVVTGDSDHRLRDQRDRLASCTTWGSICVSAKFVMRAFPAIFSCEFDCHLCGPPFVDEVLHDSGSLPFLGGQDASGQHHVGHARHAHEVEPQRRPAHVDATVSGNAK